MRRIKKKMYNTSTVHEAYGHQRQSAKPIPEVCFERSQEVNALLQEAWQLKHKEAERRESNRLSQQASRERKALGVYVSPEAALRAELEATKRTLFETQEKLKESLQESKRVIEGLHRSQNVLKQELEEQHNEAEKSLREFLQEINNRFASLKFTLAIPVVGKGSAVQQCNNMRQEYLTDVEWFQARFAKELKSFTGGRRRLLRRSSPF